jgi:murein DD-endopeptidase MepM/ murein hydrolase activator NlpD
VLRSYNDGPYDVYHSGVDYALPVGAPVQAPAGGRVIFADTLRLRGNVVIVDHGRGVMTAYFHLDRIDVTVGQQVAAGESLGAVGNTGLSSGPHLHWDLRVNGVPVDSPDDWCGHKRSILGSGGALTPPDPKIELISRRLGLAPVAIRRKYGCPAGAGGEFARYSLIWYYLKLQSWIHRRSFSDESAVT